MEIGQAISLQVVPNACWIRYMDHQENGHRSFWNCDGQAASSALKLPMKMATDVAEDVAKDIRFLIK